PTVISPALSGTIGRGEEPKTRTPKPASAPLKPPTAAPRTRVARLDLRRSGGPTAAGFGSLGGSCVIVAMPPNGSRLSCGRSAGGRKEVEPQTKRLASE